MKRSYPVGDRPYCPKVRSLLYHVESQRAIAPFHPAIPKAIALTVRALRSLFHQSIKTSEFELQV
ncbi:MAG: hypothetical protein WBA89_01070 [Microcoleus sp.]|uniref:hypothetical protein n=1 Tax=Microcoleus sp. TaxID=44472 RepID=UPI003C75F1C9